MYSAGYTVLNSREALETESRERARFRTGYTSMVEFRYYSIPFFSDIEEFFIKLTAKDC